jgi:hypothetical protein
VVLLLKVFDYIIIRITLNLNFSLHFLRHIEHHEDNLKLNHSSRRRETSKSSSDSLMSESEHQNLRNGIQSLMSQMDSMIAEIKNK